MSSEPKDNDLDAHPKYQHTTLAAELHARSQQTYALLGTIFDPNPCPYPPKNLPKENGQSTLQSLGPSDSTITRTLHSFSQITDIGRLISEETLDFLSGRSGFGEKAEDTAAKAELFPLSLPKISKTPEGFEDIVSKAVIKKDPAVLSHTKGAVTKAGQDEFDAVTMFMLSYVFSEEGMTPFSRLHAPSAGESRSLEQNQL